MLKRAGYTNAARGRGRPKTDSDFLATEVHRVMRAFNVGVDEACRRIARGDVVPLPTALWGIGPGGKPTKRLAVTKGSKWKGSNPRTLATRYWRWRREQPR